MKKRHKKKNAKREWKDTSAVFQDKVRTLAERLEKKRKEMVSEKGSAEPVN